MIRIAICDDDVQICSQLEMILRGYEDLFVEEIAIDTFSSSLDFEESLKRKVPIVKGDGRPGTFESYHLIFLDIEMPGLSGIEMGNAIRNELNDEMTQIVYVSSHTSYAMQLFQVRPMDFIVKPFSRQDVDMVMKKAYKLMGIDRGVFVYTVNKEKCRVYIHQILYFESDARKIIMHMATGEKEFYGKMSELCESTLLKHFICIHKSFFVNYNYIRNLNSDKLELTDGTILPISQKNRKRVMQQFLELESN